MNPEAVQDDPAVQNILPIAVGEMALNPQNFKKGGQYVRQAGAVMLAAGILRGVGAFVPSTTSPADAVQLLYLLTDICILFGFIGWFAAIHQAVGAWGFVAFVLGVLGILVIRSSAAFPDVALYPLGALLLEVGLNTLALADWKTHRLPVWVPSLLLLSVMAGVASYTASGLGWLLMLSGVLFGIGTGGVGLSLRPLRRSRVHDVGDQRSLVSEAQ